MFDDLDMDGEEWQKPVKKKKEELVEMKSQVAHSSLDYHTIKVPPMVEYKSIDHYCEKKGEQFLSGFDPPLATLRSISSPVLLRTPQPPQPDSPLRTSGCQPFCFFSVEELSLVKALNNWTNRKVCAVGKLEFICETNEWYLNSVGETGFWKILVNLSNLSVLPETHTTLQLYGVVDVPEGKPKIDVSFVRYLGSADLPLLVESYKLMQRYVPRYINVLKNSEAGGMSVGASCEVKDNVERSSEDDSFTECCHAMVDSLEMSSYNNL